MSEIGFTGECWLLDVGLEAELGSSAGVEITLTLEPSLWPQRGIFYQVVVQTWEGGA